MTHEWTNWQDHDGMGMPVPAGTWVHVKYARLQDAEGSAGSEGGWSWDWEYCAKDPRFDRILRYRIRKPRGSAILREIVASPEREIELA